MTLQYSTALRNTRNDAITTAIGASGLLRWYAGAVPASAEASLGAATLLAELPCSATFAPGSASGLLTANAISPAAAVGSGTATFYRLYKSDGTTPVVQGTITATGGGGDLTLDNTSITAGQNCSQASYSITANGA